MPRRASSNRDPRVDAYIAQAAEFAQPILAHLRDVVHEHCPDVEEDIKWGMPAFLYKGMLCGMAAFKRHCTFGFWKHKLVTGVERDDSAMGQFGCIASIEDLPPRKVLGGFVRTAMQLNEAGIKLPRAPRATRPAPKLPEDFGAALAGNRKASAVYAGFSPSAQREYVDWIAEAKRAETRAKRIATAVEWLAEGKPRNWKYINC